MILLLIALLAGFLIGWGLLLKVDVGFTIQYLIVLLALLEALSIGWSKWRNQALEAKPKVPSAIVIKHFLIAIIYGFIILGIGNTMGKNLEMLATLPIATVLLVNLYKIVSDEQK